MSKLTYKFQTITSPLFREPWSICGDHRDGTVYIADRVNGTLMRLLSDSSTPDQSVRVPLMGSTHIRVAAGLAHFTGPDTYDVMVLTREVLYRVPVTEGNLGTAEQVTGSSALTQMTDVSSVYYDDILCWFVTTSNGHIVRIPNNSSVANKEPLVFPGMTSCHGISCTLPTYPGSPPTDRIYVTNAVMTSLGTTQASVTSINSQTFAAGVKPPSVISGASLVLPGPIAAMPYPGDDGQFVFVGNTGSLNSLARISHDTGELDPKPITGGGIFNPLRIVCRTDPATGNSLDMFVLNQTSTITRFPDGTSTPDPTPISGGGMNECQDMAYSKSDSLFVSNPFKKTVTKITWTESAA